MVIIFSIFFLVTKFDRIKTFLHNYQFYQLCRIIVRVADFAIENTSKQSTQMRALTLKKLEKVYFNINIIVRPTICLFLANLALAWWAYVCHLSWVSSNVDLSPFTCRLLSGVQRASSHRCPTSVAHREWFASDQLLIYLWQLFLNVHSVCVGLGHRTCSAAQHIFIGHSTRNAFTKIFLLSTFYLFIGIFIPNDRCKGCLRWLFLEHFVLSCFSYTVFQAVYI